MTFEKCLGTLGVLFVGASVAVVATLWVGLLVVGVVFVAFGALFEDW